MVQLVAVTVATVLMAPPGVGALGAGGGEAPMSADSRYWVSVPESEWVSPPAEQGILSPPAMVQLEEARRLREAGDFAGAEKALLEVQRLAPEWTPVLFNLALMAGAQGKWEEQGDYLERYEPHVSEELRPTIRSMARKAWGHHYDRERLESQRKSLGLWAGLGLLFGATFTGLGIAATVAYASDPETNGDSMTKTMMGIGYAVGPAAIVGGSFAIAGRVKRKRLLQASKPAPTLTLGPTPTFRIEF